MTAANTQATVIENPSTTDEGQNLPASADYPAVFSGGDSDAWAQDTQNEWIPGFGRMVSESHDLMRRYAQVNVRL
jgi:hypothetical protein